ncbi:MAG TPA: hypothetical protein VGR26_17095 [Acidimicrobiales bacterium]|nr:hypothetical protein [Acidimicrobiales bacterium]
MPERRSRPDLDERFSLHPLEGEEVLKRLMEDGDDDDLAEDENS